MLSIKAVINQNKLRTANVDVHLSTLHVYNAFELYYMWLLQNVLHCTCFTYCKYYNGSYAIFKYTCTTCVRTHVVRVDFLKLI